jgi:hypothetical protein
MAAGVVRLSDVIVPAIFTPYVQNLTQEKSRLIASGAITRDAILDNNLSGAGITFNEPSFKDLENDAENVSTDDPAQNSSPNKIGTLSEIQVRMSRNNSWSSMDLTADLIAEDPLAAIANRVADYWKRREQAAFIATMKGVFADNATVTDAYHTQNDMTFNVSGASFTAGVTNFTAEAFIDGTLTMGDSMESLGMICVHSVVYGRMLKNNLIDFVFDSNNPAAIRVPMFLGREVIVDDGMPFTGGVFESWMFGSGSIRNGRGSPRVPTEVFRAPSAGNGSGQDTLFNRVEWCLAPVGYAYIGTAASGGPSNAATTNNLAAATSWRRVFPERKQVKIARLITREF